MDEVTTVYFLDVGQGTSNVLQFADGSVAIIDCGESAVALVTLLQSIKFTRIRAIVLSHWHDDHTGGVPAVLDNFLDAIDCFYLSQDRPAHLIRANKVFALIRQKSKQQTKYRVERLEKQDLNEGKIPLPPDVKTASLSVLYPDFLESLDAQSQKDGNQGSGVLLLEHGAGRIVFPGDAGKKAFKALMKREGDTRIQCDVLAAPHHSGKLNKGSDDFSGHRNCFHWLYSDVIETKYVVVSAGTGNNYGHPLEEHVHEAVASGATVVCTQITPRCHRTPDKVAPALLEPIENPSACGFGDGFGCAGTVVAKMQIDRIELEREKKHRDAVDTIASSESPLCRGGSHTAETA